MSASKTFTAVGELRICVHVYSVHLITLYFVDEKDAHAVLPEGVKLQTYGLRVGEQGHLAREWMEVPIDNHSWQLCTDTRYELMYNNKTVAYITPRAGFDVVAVA